MTSRRAGGKLKSFMLCSLLNGQGTLVPKVRLWIAELHVASVWGPEPSGNIGAPL